MIKIVFEEGVSKGRWARFDTQNTVTEQHTFESIAELDSLAAQYPSESWLGVFAGTQVSIASADMPIKHVRQIIKALPFAIEEQLASDIHENHLVYLGKESGKAQAAVVELSYMDTLNRFTVLRGLTPLTLLLPVQGDCWSVYLDDRNAFVRQAETLGFVCPAAQLPLFLDLAKTKAKIEHVSLLLLSNSDSDMSLMHAQLETAGYEIHSQAIDGIWSLIDSKSVTGFSNLLVGDYKPAQPKKAKKPSVLKGVMALAASVFALGLLMNFWQAKTAMQLATDVRKASESYYTTLFPGERMPKLSRQIKSKFNSGSSDGGETFTQSLGAIGEPLKNTTEFNSIVLHGVRYNEKRGGYDFELTAASIAQLENYKKSLIERGFSVEITSATNESSGVKGQIKVKRNG